MKKQSRFSDLPQRFFVVIGMLAVIMPFLCMGGIYMRALLLLLYASLIAELLHASRQAHWIKRLKICFLGMLWLMFSFPVVWESTYWPQNVMHRFFLFVMLLVILTDTAAYAGGRLLKGPKLAPRISPGKTWSGFTSGLICGGLWTATYLYKLEQHSMPVFLCLCMAFPLSAIAGDLAGSFLKRHLHIKDFSALLPGHGGLWDRMDSFLGVFLYTTFLYALNTHFATKSFALFVQK